MAIDDDLDNEEDLDPDAYNDLDHLQGVADAIWSGLEEIRRLVEDYTEVYQDRVTNR